MNWYQDLYVGSRMQKKKEKFISEMERGHKDPKAYLLVFPVNQQNQLEIIPARGYSDEKRCIVGIAADKSEAVDLVLKITNETYLKNKNADMKTYLIEKQRDNEMSDLS